MYIYLKHSYRRLRRRGSASKAIASSVNHCCTCASRVNKGNFGQEPNVLLKKNFLDWFLSCFLHVDMIQSAGAFTNGDCCPVM